MDGMERVKRDGHRVHDERSLATMITTAPIPRKWFSGA